MTSLKSFFAAVLLAGALIVTGSIANQAQAQGPRAFEGDFMVRILGAGIFPDTDLGTITANGAPAFNPSGVDIDTTVVPATTLTYFLSRNIGIELFCCISTVDIKGTGTLAAANVIDLGSTSFFAPTVTLQYHIPMGNFKPYVGAGINYLMFFDESVGQGINQALGVTRLDIDNSWGFALQAGLDVALGGGWSLNMDIKKIFNETDAKFSTPGLLVRANDVQIDPLIVSIGVGYRFDTCALFDRCAAEPLK